MDNIKKLAMLQVLLHASCILYDDSPASASAAAAAACYGAGL
jgi:hypothetical protein